MPSRICVVKTCREFEEAPYNVSEDSIDAVFQNYANNARKNNIGKRIPPQSPMVTDCCQIRINNFTFHIYKDKITWTYHTPLASGYLDSKYLDNICGFLNKPIPKGNLIV